MSNITAHTPDRTFIELRFDKIYPSITTDVLAGERIYIATDSKEECEMIRNHILQLQKENSSLDALKILAITSDNAKSREVTIANNAGFDGYDIIITSPAIYIIEFKRELNITKTYGIFRGESIYHRDLLQLLYRTRYVAEIKYAFSPITEKTDPIRMYFSEKEIEKGLDSNERIKKILKTTALSYPKISNNRPYHTQRKEISYSEKTRFYKSDKLQENIDVSAHGLPVNSMMFNIELLKISTLSKYLSRPAFYFRNFIISSCENYYIDKDLMEGCTSRTKSINPYQFEDIDIYNKSINLLDMYKRSQINFLNLRAIIIT